ncbi:response regulator [Chondromyces apiculatus]|uniref:DNA-binding response regulator n=1 Tax=Chondromyces apiculatus DSM 436 TaxID=1192034 RepID=A0A017SXL0_9BACT|nr:response regulator [Chondromyces apiculatus]EYF01021.1 DNA-binding response regulator [Chondromyces apiculatus DSM 436]
MYPDILILDDSLTVRTDLQSALAAAGYRVTACSSMVSAKQELDRRPFALIILDVVLPDGDGLDLLRELKAAPEHAAMRVIVLSTESEVKSRVRGLATGADEYVGKPYDPSYILRCVRRFLGPSPTGQPTPERGVGERKILAIGARSTYLTVLAERLRLDRHDVTLTYSLEEASQFLSLTSVDCVVVDAAAPGIDADEVCRRLKVTSSWSTIPVLLLSDAPPASVVGGGLLSPQDAVASRSTNLTSVRAKLRELLRQRSSDHKRPAVEQPVPRDNSLFTRLVATSGIPSTQARATLDRALMQAGVQSHNLTPETLEAALSAVERAFLAFMTPEEARWRIKAVAALARLARSRRDRE